MHVAVLPRRCAYCNLPIRRNHISVMDNGYSFHAKACWNSELEDRAERVPPRRYKRVVTDEVIDVAPARFWTRWGAERALSKVPKRRHHNGEYLVQRLGWRYRIVVHEVVMVPVVGK